MYQFYLQADKYITISEYKFWQAFKNAIKVKKLLNQLSWRYLYDKKYLMELSNLDWDKEIKMHHMKIIIQKMN